MKKVVLLASSLSWELEHVSLFTSSLGSRADVPPDVAGKLLNSEVDPRFGAASPGAASAASPEAVSAA